jgi:hypothetical protein
VDQLKLLPFELRALAQRRVPNRWVINLNEKPAAGKVNRLYHSQVYARIPLEDRLFVPERYVPLFVAKGWEAAVPPGLDAEFKRKYPSLKCVVMPE